MRTVTTICALLVFVFCAGILHAEKATSSVTELMAGKFGGLLAKSAKTTATAASKPAAKPAAKEAALDISAGDFSPRRKPAETQPIVVGRPTAKRVKPSQSSQYEQEEEEPVEEDPNAGQPKLARKPIKASMRNVGYTYDASGNRLYEDGTVTNQTGDIYYHYGSAVKYE